MSGKDGAMASAGSEAVAAATLVRLAPPGFDVEPLLAELTRAYAEPPRAYHSLAHVVEVAERFAEVAAARGWSRPAEVYAAILFHDAIYVAGAPDNEARSAELARVTLAAAAPRVDRERVVALIEATALHGKLDAAAVDEEAALFLDCDMAILAAPPERFQAYERGIREEYAIVPDELFAKGRAAFLDRVAAAERIFLSPYFHERLDASARRNLLAARAHRP